MSSSVVQAAETGVAASTARSGRETMAATGVSGPSPSASTRLRKSRSVTMPGGSPRTSTDETFWSRMTRAASPTVASASTQMAGRRSSCPTSSCRSALKVVTGECSRLLLSRCESPTAKWPANWASPSSRWNCAAGSR